MSVDYLSDFVVVELATGIAGPYAGKLFADAGAQVIKVEPPGGDPERHRSAPGVELGGRDAALFQHLNAGKRSLVGEYGTPRVDALIERADLVIESFVPERLDVPAWRSRKPSLVILSVTPFGRRGPWKDRPATGFTLQAESGSIGSRGSRDQPPFQAGGQLQEWAGGVFGAVGALAAVLRGRRTGSGEHVDCALLAADHMITCGNMCVRDSFLGHPDTPGPARILDVPSIEPTSDGHIGVNTNTSQQVRSFLELVGRSDLLESEPRWASAEYRMLHAAEWNAQVRPWIRAHSTAEVMEAAARLRIPVAPVNNGRTLLTQEHFRFRGSLGEFPGGAFVHPRPPYRIAGERPEASGPAPRLDADAGFVPQPGAVEESLAVCEPPAVPEPPPVPEPPAAPAPPSVPEPPAGPEPAGSGASMPFDGLRVLDATSMWAGPVVGQLFAALGADVLHLESVQRLDLSRLKVDNASAVPHWWERGHTWSMVNWNKRDITLDLGQREGRELLESLLAHCDVFVENYSPRVFEKFGLTAERVKEINPNLVFVRMPAFGLDGPWRDYIGFAQTMEQMSGLAWLTGWVEDEAPAVPRGPCDPLAGYHTVFAVMVALRRRALGGGGAMVEAAMAESALNAAAESVIDFSAYGVLLDRTGNRSQDAAPEGLYACRGDEQWLALSVAGDEQWDALCKALDNPAWADRADLRTVAGRRSAHDAIDAELARWASDRSVEDAVEQLVSHGVPAGRVVDPRRADSHPQLNAFGYFEEVEHPLLGKHRLPTLPFRFAGVERWVRSSAPYLGEHNDEVLRGLLGLDESELAALRDSWVIGNEPLASNPTFTM